MKKYLCKTSIAGLYEQGEVYKLSEDKRVRMHVRLGYLEEVPMNFSKPKKRKSQKKKEVDKE